MFVSSGESKNVQLYRGQGCNYCYDSGCRGRKAIYEILCVSPEIRKMTVNAGNDNAIAQQAIKEGMKTLRKSGIEQVLNGSTTFEKVVDKVFWVVNKKTKEPVESSIDKALQSGKTECGTEYDTPMSRKGTESDIPSATSQLATKVDVIYVLPNISI